MSRWPCNVPTVQARVWISASQTTWCGRDIIGVHVNTPTYKVIGYSVPFNDTDEIYTMYKPLSELGTPLNEKTDSHGFWYTRLQITIKVNWSLYISKHEPAGLTSRVRYAGWSGESHDMPWNGSITTTTTFPNSSLLETHFDFHYPNPLQQNK